MLKGDANVLDCVALVPSLLYFASRVQGLRVFSTVARDSG